MTPGCLEAGCDEAGRGCLAGPVVAAAVILPMDYNNELLRDSKQLTEKKRDELRKIIEKEALSYSIAFIDNKIIDEINILKASILAMHEALSKLNQQPEHIIVDGNRFYQYGNIPHTCVIKGDDKYISIAAASILAKTYRDEIMIRLHESFPEYNWKRNKGYPTREHKETIRQSGITPYHRQSFRLYDEQLKIRF